jgi:spore maturation protein CgeB
MRIKTVETIEEFKACFGLTHDGLLLESDLDVVETDCDLDGRKRRDAEVLCTLAANVTGPCLDLGTSHGRSAFKLATNLGGRGTVFTVNILPEQHHAASGELVTHLLPKELLGLYFRERGISGIEQIYADTMRWTMPEALRDLAIVFVDAAHDEENVLTDSRNTLDRVREGGFVVWHDFSPELRPRWGWIDAVMRGVERFMRDVDPDAEIVTLKGSWSGVWRKTTRTAAARTEPLAESRASTERPSVTVDVVTTGREIRRAAASAAPPFGDITFHVIYPNYGRARVDEEEGLASRTRALGYRIETVGIPCPEGWLPFPKLDAAWRRGDSGLMRAYEEIGARVRSGDILIASGGSMVHPEFVRQLPSLNVFTCGDDPESSEILSRPAAPSFDVSLIGNVTCLGMYRSWGCRHVDWLYQAIRPEFLDPAVTEESILAGGRDIDAMILCERGDGLSDRAQRIERLLGAFPLAVVRGRGWPGGPVDPRPIYLRARIGWNLHHSIGPCNMRLTTLPALGVMQLCDNKRNLGELFTLDEEIVGFDTIDECIDKTRYYLAHEEERRAIAARGWKRAMRDYTEPQQWRELLRKITPAYDEKFGLSAAAATDRRSSTLAPGAPEIR